MATWLTCGRPSLWAQCAFSPNGFLVLGDDLCVYILRGEVSLKVLILFTLWNLHSSKLQVNREKSPSIPLPFPVWRQVVLPKWCVLVLILS